MQPLTFTFTATLPGDGNADFDDLADTLFNATRKLDTLFRNGVEPFAGMTGDVYGGSWVIS